MTTSMQNPILTAGPSSAQGDIAPDAVRHRKRPLNRLVEAIGSAFQPAHFVVAQHVVTGVFIGPYGEGHQASLFYNKKFRLAGLTLHLHPREVMSFSHLVCLLRVQGQAQLARLNYEPQDYTLILCAGSIWLTNQDPTPVLKPIIKDIRHVLADDRLRAIAA